MDTPYLTLGEVATRIGCQVWQVARVIDRGLVPPPKRIGRNRVLVEKELPGMKRALEEAGFLKK